MGWVYCRTFSTGVYTITNADILIHAEQRALTGLLGRQSGRHLNLQRQRSDVL